MSTEGTKSIVEFTTKSFKVFDDSKRIVEGIATAQIVDKQAEYAITKAFMATASKFLQTSAALIDWHSNRPVGKVHELTEVMLKGDDGSEVPAVKIKAEIYNRGYALDNNVWQYIKDGTYKGFSFGGAVHTGAKEPIEVNGRLAYALKSLELYEISVCPSPVNPLSVITNFNAVAKAEGKPVCNNMVCYYEAEPVVKSEPTVEHKLTVKIEADSEELKKAIGNAIQEEVGRMYINTKDINITKSDNMTDNKNVSEETKKSDAPASTAATSPSVTDLAKAISDAFAPTLNSLNDSVQKLTKAMETPTNLGVSDKQEVKMPSDPYNGKSQQGGQDKGSDTPAKTDTVVLEQKATTPAEVPKAPEQVIKTETPRPAVNTIPQITQNGNSILNYLRKSNDGDHRFGTIANKILYEQGFVDRVLKGESI